MNRDTQLASLRADLKDGKVAVIAGTGVAIAICANQQTGGHAVATWTGLLQHGVDHCEGIGALEEREAELLRALIRSGKSDFLINAAEIISQRLKSRSDGVYRGWLKETVGSLTVQEPAIGQVLGEFPGLLTTLNFDGLLELTTNRVAVTWLQTDRTQSVLRREVTDAVLHLHGWYDEPASIVLGTGSYLTVGDHPHAATVLKLLTLDRTLLFVGCGDTLLDPNFERLVDWGRAAQADISPRNLLLCRTGDLERMHERLRRAPWVQALAYGESYADLAPFLTSLLPASGEVFKHQSRPPLDFQTYRAAITKYYGRLKLEELDPTSSDDHPRSLSKMFIAQNALECTKYMPQLFELPKDVQSRLRSSRGQDVSNLEAKMRGDYRRLYEHQTSRSALDLVQSSHLDRLVILGDPGSGKSSLLQYVMVTWAEQLSLDEPPPPLSLLIELREYARLRQRGEIADFLDYLSEGASVRCRFDRTQLDAWLRHNTSVIMFDGFDEVFSPDLRKEVATAIFRYADDYPRSRVVMTSRVIGFQPQPWRDERFRIFMLEDLDDLQITDFLDRWHAFAHQDDLHVDTKRTVLARAIEDSPAIRQIAGNPLLLTMMGIINRTQDLPRDRAELYSQCTRLLLHQWKVDVAFSTYPDLAQAALDYKDKRTILLRVARKMQANAGSLSTNVIEEEMLETTLSEGLAGIPNIRAARAARALIEQLRGRNFMLCSVGSRSYAFVHRTFLEYFCALEILERFENKQILSIDDLKTKVYGNWKDETWHEILCLLAGMLAPRFVEEVVYWLLAQTDTEYLSGNVLLAAKCLAEVRRRSELKTCVVMIRGELEKILIGAQGTYYSIDDQNFASSIRANALVLCATLQRDEPRLRDWLVRAIHRCSDGYARARGIQELARGGRNDASVFRILKHFVESVEEDRLARRVAMIELVRGWRHVPETRSLLEGIAMSPDDDGSVCAAAVEEVARNWKSDPTVLEWLNVLLRSEEGFAARRSAVHVLARQWKHMPETQMIVKSRAQSDGNWTVRVVALQELAHGWREDTQTLLSLKALAESDSDHRVRQAALLELERGWRGDDHIAAFLQAIDRGNRTGGGINVR
jgi:hypothetical protein